MEEEAEGNVHPISYSQAYPRLSLLLPIFLKIEAGFILKADSCSLTKLYTHSPLSVWVSLIFLKGLGLSNLPPQNQLMSYDKVF